MSEAQDWADKASASAEAQRQARLAQERDLAIGQGDSQILGPSVQARQANILQDIYTNARLAGVTKTAQGREQRYSNALSANLAKAQGRADMWAGGASLINQAFQGAQLGSGIASKVPGQTTEQPAPRRVPSPTGPYSSPGSH